LEMGLQYGRGRYPTNWADLSSLVRSKAGWCCEACGLRHLSWGWRDASGAFHEVPRGPLLDAGYRRPPFWLPLDDGRSVRIIEIILAAAHLDDPNPSNPDWGNLGCLCQRCHVLHDTRLRLRKSAATRRAAMNTFHLFHTLDQPGG
jgi:hypothetical protein